MRRSRIFDSIATVVAFCCGPAIAGAQQTRDLGLPPPFDNPALPPAVNPALPPPTGQRYVPGTSGPFASPDRPAAVIRPPRGVDSVVLRGDLRASRPGASGEQLSRLRDLIPHIRACWEPPERGATMLDATIRFSLRRDGALAGEPRITYVSRLASPGQRETLVGSIRAAFDRCAPLPLTPRFGAAVAGRPISIRFILDAPSTRT